MSVLSTPEILRRIEHGEIVIDPFNPDKLKDACYAFTMSERIGLLWPSPEPIDIRATDADLRYTVIADAKIGYTLLPGAFAVLETVERLRLSDRIFCLLGTRPTLAQIGLDLVQSSTHVPPRSDCRLALETSNRGPRSVRLFPGVPVVKAIFISVS